MYNNTQDSLVANDWKIATNEWKERLINSNVPSNVRLSLINWFKEEARKYAITEDSLKKMLRPKVSTLVHSYLVKKEKATIETLKLKNMQEELADSSIDLVFQEIAFSIDKMNEKSILLKSACDAMSGKDGESVDPLRGYFYNENNGLLFWLNSYDIKSYEAVAVSWFETGLFDKYEMDALWKESIECRKKTGLKFRSIKGMMIEDAEDEIMPQNIYVAIEAGGLRFRFSEILSTADKPVLDAL